MPIQTKILAIACCLALALCVVELVRKKSMREEYSLLWLVSTIVLAILIFFDGFTLKLVRWLGGINPASLYFFAGVFFSILLLLHLTVRISELKRKQNVLLQEAALLRERIENLERSSVDTVKQDNGSQT
ncbi:MAG: DUF2304 domain-containing protein [Acidobacteria bacterium]|nr:DUF2304 domain-containing protein [Acidobacteriota bacterium]